MEFSRLGLIRIDSNDLLLEEVPRGMKEPSGRRVGAQGNPLDEAALDGADAEERRP
jgi:hypothetical protein